MRAGRRAGLLLGALAGSAAVLALAPELDAYRGLSGLDSVLFVLLAVRLRVERAFRSAWTRPLPALAVALFLVELALESRSGRACFVGDAHVVPVPVAHLAGGVAGLLAGVWPPAGHDRGPPAASFR